MKGSLRISFPECPNKCKNGFLFNPYTGVTIPCEYCANKRSELVKTEGETESGTIYEQLHITNMLTADAFDMERLIPTNVRQGMVTESITALETQLNEIMSKMSIGEFPSYSILFNFGFKVNTEIFTTPFMIKAFRAGINVAPMVTALELVRLRFQYEDMEDLSYNKDGWGNSYDDYIKADICVVNMDAGTTYRGVLAVKGLMQLRALKGKPTYIVTSIWGSSVMELVSGRGNTERNLASLISVEYKKKEQNIADANTSSTTPSNAIKFKTPTKESVEEFKSGFGVSRDSFQKLLQDTPKSL